VLKSGKAVTDNVPWKLGARRRLTLPLLHVSVARLVADIVFLRAWVPIMPRKFYIPVTNLLQADKSTWQGMRRVGELRRELKVPVPNKPDSEYKPIVRTERKFAPLVIPKALQASLPFASKVRCGQHCSRLGIWVWTNVALVRASADAGII